MVGGESRVVRGQGGPRRTLSVVAGVLRDASGRILLARRPEGKPLAGFWEFPGGKIEPGETPEDALRRELQEELGLEPIACLPLIEIRYAYPDFRLRLKTLEVLRYRGTPQPKEHQALVWVAPGELPRFLREMPPADRPIVKALQLPPFGAILEGLEASQYLRRLKALAQSGFRLFYLRARHLLLERYRALVQRALSWLEETPDRLLMVRDPDLAPHPQLVLHLDSERLSSILRRPAGWKWVSAACHDLEELKRAEAVGADFALLSPIEGTPTHPEAQPIGWARAAQWLREVSLPVYLLGGMERSDWKRARNVGAQGVFGLRMALL